MTRQRLPNRRPNETVDVTHDGRTYAITIGFDPATGEVREIFANDAKTGSAMDGAYDGPEHTARSPAKGLMEKP